jgi:hypothetical protein
MSALTRVEMPLANLTVYPRILGCDYISDDTFVA